MRKTKIEMPMLDFLLSEEKVIENVKPIYEKVTSELVKPKYRPLGKSQTYILVIFDDSGKEVSHWSCEEIDVDEFKTISEKGGRRVEKYTSEEYWRNYHLGKFQMK